MFSFIFRPSFCHRMGPETKYLTFEDLNASIFNNGWNPGYDAINFSISQPSFPEFEPSPAWPSHAPAALTHGGGTFTDNTKKSLKTNPTMRRTY